MLDGLVFFAGLILTAIAIAFGTFLTKVAFHLAEEFDFTRKTRLPKKTGQDPTRYADHVKNGAGWLDGARR